MRFYSIVSNINYEVIPTDYEYIGPNHRKKVPGISARFHSHMFDTKQAQETLKWTDDQRTLVEDYLLGHENFNTAWLQLVPESEPEMRAKEFEEQKICISRTVTDEGVVDCDQQAVEGQYYCKRHLATLSEVNA